MLGRPSPALPETGRAVQGPEPIIGADGRLVSASWVVLYAVTDAGVVADRAVDADPVLALERDLTAAARAELRALGELRSQAELLNDAAGVGVDVHHSLGLQTAGWGIRVDAAEVTIEPPPPPGPRAAPPPAGSRDPVLQRDERAGPVVTVPIAHAGVVTRGGALREVLEPGVRTVNPLRDRLTRVDLREHELAVGVARVLYAVTDPGTLVTAGPPDLPDALTELVRTALAVDAAEEDPAARGLAVRTRTDAAVAAWGVRINHIDIAATQPRELP